MANNKYFVTPKGSAGYPKLIEPDTKFNSQGVYTTSLTLTKEAAAPLIEQIEEVFTDEYGPKKLSSLVTPYKTDDETGDVTFKFKSKSKPTLFDAAGTPVKASKGLKIGSGSTLKVKGTIVPTLVQGKYYASLWMSAVQIIELVEYNSNGGFGAEQGGFRAEDVAEDDDEETQDTPVGANGNDEEDF